MTLVKRARASLVGVTEGPWQWFGNTKLNEVYLATKDRGRILVMDFVRWGMSGAQPRFQVALEDGADGYGVMRSIGEMAKNEEVSKPAVVFGPLYEVPTEQGRALGKEPARLCDVEEERQRAQFPNQQPRCNDCAFRAGTNPNGCSETLMDALKCVIEQEPFYCHKGLDETGNAKHICRGWWLMVATKDGAP
jgi:hypothetical protein